MDSTFSPFVTDSFTRLPCPYAAWIFLAVMSYGTVAVWAFSPATRRPGGWHAPRPRKTFAGRPTLDGFQKQIVNFHTPFDRVES
jgi:hypothetical protein